MTRSSKAQLEIAPLGLGGKGRFAWLREALVVAVHSWQAVGKQQGRRTFQGDHPYKISFMSKRRFVLFVNA